MGKSKANAKHKKDTVYRNQTEYNAVRHYVKGIKNGQCDVEKTKRENPVITGGWKGHCGICEQAKDVIKYKEEQHKNWMSSNIN